MPAGLILGVGEGARQSGAPSQEEFRERPLFAHRRHCTARLKGLNPLQSGRERNRRFGFWSESATPRRWETKPGPTAFRSIPFRIQETMLLCLGRRKKGRRC